MERLWNKYSRFVYLGSLSNSDARCEIRRRFEIYKNLLSHPWRSTSNDIGIAVRLRVWSVMRGQHCCTAVRRGLSLEFNNTWKHFETWLYRGMVRISWKDNITNQEVYHRVSNIKALMVDVLWRQMSFLWHHVRTDELENIVVTCFFMTNVVAVDKDKLFVYISAR